MNYTRKYRESISSSNSSRFVRSFVELKVFYQLRKLNGQPGKARDNICFHCWKRPRLGEVCPVPSPICLWYSWYCEVQLADDSHRRPLSDAGKRTTTDVWRDVGDTPVHRSNISEANKHISILILIYYNRAGHAPSLNMRSSPLVVDTVTTPLRVITWPLNTCTTRTEYLVCFAVGIYTGISANPKTNKIVKHARLQNNNEVTQQLVICLLFILVSQIKPTWILLPSEQASYA